MNYAINLPEKSRKRYLDEIVKIIEDIRAEKHKEETELTADEAEYVKQAIADDDEREKNEKLADEIIREILNEYYSEDEESPAKKIKTGGKKKRGKKTYKKDNKKRRNTKKRDYGTEF